MHLHFISWTWIELLLNKYIEAHDTARTVALELENNKGWNLKFCQ